MAIYFWTEQERAARKRDLNYDVGGLPGEPQIDDPLQAKYLQVIT